MQASALHIVKASSPDSWSAFAKPAKKCPVGTKVTFEDGLWCEVVNTSGAAKLKFLFTIWHSDLDNAILEQGAMPLPPYIKRESGPDEEDDANYQTLFAKHSGAVAAPTAGLHFTDELRSRLAEKGVHLAEVTLHVGAGTFLPVKVDNIHDHKMHSEWGALDEETAKKLNKNRDEGAGSSALAQPLFVF